MDPQEFYRSKRDALIKEFESFRAEPYLDAHGIPTIGWGATSYEDGTAVTMNDPAITAQRGEELYNHHVGMVTDQLQSVPNWNQLSLSQQAALTSFGFNTGAGVFTNPEGYETLQTAVATGDSDNIGAAMKLYIDKGTSAEAGLRRRRDAEVELMNTTYPALEQFNGIVKRAREALGY